MWAVCSLCGAGMAAQGELFQSKPSDKGAEQQPCSGRTPQEPESWVLLPEVTEIWRVVYQHHTAASKLPDRATLLPKGISQLLSVPFGDCMHIAVANSTGCICFVAIHCLFNRSWFFLYFIFQSNICTQDNISSHCFPHRASLSRCLSVLRSQYFPEESLHSTPWSKPMKPPTKVNSVSCLGVASVLLSKCLRDTLPSLYVHCVHPHSVSNN